MRISDWSSDVCSSDLFARFFDSHGLLNVYQRPQWQTVVGGSRSYLRALCDKFTGALKLSTPVESLQRKPGGGVMLTANGSEHDVDAGVCAAHSDQIGRASCRERVCQYV